MSSFAVIQLQYGSGYVKTASPEACPEKFSMEEKDSATDPPDISLLVQEASALAEGEYASDDESVDYNRDPSLIVPSNLLPKSKPKLIAERDALHVPVLRQTVASYVPRDVFRCSCVSKGWQERWSAEDSFSLCFCLDFTGCSLRPEDVKRIVRRIRVASLSVHLNFQSSRICEEGAKQLAAHVPGRLTSLSLNLKECKIGDRGATAIAECIPEGLTSLTLNFAGGNIIPHGAT